MQNKKKMKVSTRHYTKLVSTRCEKWLLNVIHTYQDQKNFNIQLGKIVGS